VQETCNFDVLYAYLTCGNYDFSYDKSKNLRAPPRPRIGRSTTSLSVLLRPQARAATSATP